MSLDAERNIGRTRLFCEGEEMASTNRELQLQCAAGLPTTLKVSLATCAGRSKKGFPLALTIN
jgi:hypothetical protein